MSWSFRVKVDSAGAKVVQSWNEEGFVNPPDGAHVPEGEYTVSGHDQDSYFSVCVSRSAGGKQKLSASATAETQTGGGA